MRPKSAAQNPPLGLVAASTALLLPLLVHPSVLGSEWSVRYAALAVIVTVGGVALVRLLGTGARGVARWAIGLAGWAAVCALVAPQPGLAIWGIFGVGSGALFVLALVGSWAIGTSAGTARDRVEQALLVAAGLNAAIAVVQTLIDLSALDLPLFEGERAPGLMGNPVFLGGLLVGTLWIALCRMAGPGGAWPWAPFVGLLGVGLQLTGSRFALALAVAAIVIAALVRTIAGIAVVVAVVALVAGVGIGSAISSARGSLSGTERAFSQPVASGGLSHRFETWRTAPQAVVERPIFGHGPNRYGEATGPLRSLRLSQRGPETLYVDAHNIFVEYAVTTGLPGLLLLVGFLVAAIRRARLRSPLGGFAVLVLAGHLLQPQHVALTPLALLALGAAGPDAGESRMRIPRPVWFGAAAIGVAGALTLLYGAWKLEQARLDFTEDQARAGSRAVPPWPEPRTLLARIFTFESINAGRDAELAARALAWRREAVAYDRSDPSLWNSLAEAEYDAGMDRDAKAHFQEALARNPWSVRALNGLGFLALRAGDEDEALAHFRRSLEVQPAQDEIPAKVDQLQEARAA